MKDMEMNETKRIGDYIEITRVPTGWVYTFISYGPPMRKDFVFVPEKSICPFAERLLNERNKQ